MDHGCVRYAFWTAVGLVVFGGCAGDEQGIEPVGGGGGPAASMSLDFTQDERHLRLVARHPQLGQVFELWCYEGGPFRQGTPSKRPDGSVVFTHKSRNMTATTTFTPSGEGRIVMDVVVEGPLEELKKVPYMGPCMQFWHADAFMREGDLAEFVERCFYYTMRGPVTSLQTARGKMKGYAPDAPENDPPCTQWYVPPTRAHPGDIWAFGASGDRPVHGLVGVTSRDGKWLAAIGCKHNRTLGQGWHDCIHYVPDVQAYLDEQAGRTVYRVMIYIMPNNPRRLLEAFLTDFPAADDESTFQVSAGPAHTGPMTGTLRLTPSAPDAPPLTLSLDLLGGGPEKETPGADWDSKYWGTLVRTGPSWRMCAHPTGDSLELCVSLAADRWSPGRARAEAHVSAEGWVPAEAPEGVPAQVLRSAEGTWTAALFWERCPDGNPGQGVPAETEPQGKSISVRGRLILYQGDPGRLAQRWAWAKTDWQHARPFRMPTSDEGKAR